MDTIWCLVLNEYEGPFHEQIATHDGLRSSVKEREVLWRRPQRKASLLISPPKLSSRPCQFWPDEKEHEIGVGDAEGPG